MRNLLCLCLFFSNMAVASALPPKSCAASLIDQKLDADFLSRHFLSVDSWTTAYQALYSLGYIEKWKLKVPTRPGIVFRGMSVSADELNAIFRDGMLVSQAASHYGGVLWSAGQIYIPFSRILPTQNDLPEKPLAVVFEIDLTGLEAEFIDTSDRQDIFKIRQDVPPSSIRRIFIYDPSRDPEDFPFTSVSFVAD